MEYVSLVNVVNNESVERTGRLLHGIKAPKLEDLNKILACSLSDINCYSRFPSDQGTSLRKIATNLVPFPRLKFVASSMVSLRHDMPSLANEHDIILNALYCNSSLMTPADLRNGKIMSSFCGTRGMVTFNEAETQTSLIKRLNMRYFSEWIGNNFHLAHNSMSRPDSRGSTTALINTTSIRHTFGIIHKKFTSMFKRKAHLHHYTGEGMDEMEFDQSESNFTMVMDEYKEYDQATRTDQKDYEAEDN